jgi:hypothetical protein
MSAREVPGKKYVVCLGAEEREELNVMTRKGKSSAQRLMKARILLKADVSEGGEGWTDSEIVEAQGTSLTTVYRTRQQLVDDPPCAGELSGASHVGKSRIGNEKNHGQDRLRPL